MNLRGRLVVVTGASSGLGREIAVRLACEEGAEVILAARRADRLEEVRSRIDAGGGTARVCPVDLASPGGPQKLVDRSLEIAVDRDRSLTDAALRGVYGLVNCAGVTCYTPVVEMPVTEVDRILSLNLKSTIELTCLLLPHLVARRTEAGREPCGAILTITSLGAHLPMPYQAVYAASKHGLQAFCESLAGELRYGWRGPGPPPVLTVFAPGGIDTEMIEQAGLRRRFSGRSGVGSRPADAGKVAGWAVRAWRRERISAVGGIENRVARVAGRLMPLRLILRAGEGLFRP